MSSPSAEPIIIRTYDRATQQLLNALCLHYESREPFVGEIPVQVSEHRGRMRNVGGPTPLDQEHVSAEVAFTLTVEMMRNTDIDACLDQVAEAAQKLADEKAKAFFKVMDQTLVHAGQTVEGKDRSIFDVYLESLERIPIEFDEAGNPQQLRVLCGEKMAATVLRDRHFPHAWRALLDDRRKANSAAPQPTSRVAARAARKPKKPKKKT